MILFTARQWQWHNLNQTLEAQKTPHISPSWASCGVFIVKIPDEIDCVLKTLYCIWCKWGMTLFIVLEICVFALTPVFWKYWLLHCFNKWVKYLRMHDMMTNRKLTHWGLVVTHGIVEFSHREFRQWLFAHSAPSYCLNHCWLTVKISNISRTQSQNLNDSHLVVQLSLPNPLKPAVKSRMKM